MDDELSIHKTCQDNNRIKEILKFLHNILCDARHMEIMDNVTVKNLIRVIIKCMVICNERVIFKSTTEIGYIIMQQRRKQSEIALDLYKRITNNFTEYTKLISELILDISDEELYWQPSWFVMNILSQLLVNTDMKLTFWECILRTVETRMTDSNKTPNLASVIVFLRTFMALSPPVNVNIILRLWNIYRYTLLHPYTNAPHAKIIENNLEMTMKYAMYYSTYTYMAIILEQIIQICFEQQLSSVNLDKVGNLIKYGAEMYMHSKQTFWSTTSDTNMFSYVLKMIISDDERYVLLGNDILVKLLDSSMNSMRIGKPKLYLKHSEHPLTKAQAHPEQKRFAKRYKRDIFSTFVKAIERYRDNVQILTVLYKSLAIMILDLPCDVTAVILTAVAIHIQNKVRAGSHNIPLATICRMHGLAISLISLVCWTTNVDILYEFFNSIYAIRRDILPHFNPPLLSQYPSIDFHKMEDKSEYFFDEWEVRYALWKRFRIPKEQNKKLFNLNTGKRMLNWNLIE